MKSTLILCAALLCATASSPAPQKSTHKTSAPLKGHVSDKSGNKLSRAVLYLYDCDDPVKPECETILGSAMSDSHGQFALQIGTIPAGVYSLGVKLSPFWPKVKVPVKIPEDNVKSFDFTLLADHRGPSGHLIGASQDDAKEMLAAANISKDVQLQALSSQVLNEGAEQDASVIAGGPTSRDGQGANGAPSAPGGAERGPGSATPPSPNQPKFTIQCSFAGDPAAYYVTADNQIVVVAPNGQSAVLGSRTAPTVSGFAWMYATKMVMYGVDGGGRVWNRAPNGLPYQVGQCGPI